MFGLTMEEACGPPVEVWPDNVEALNVFIAMATQWRTSYGGAIGLDYNALPVVFDLVRVAQDARADVFDDLRILEDAALEQMRANNKE